MRAEYGLSHAYMISLWRSGRNGRLTGARRLCQREIAHQVYCEPLTLFRAFTVGLPSRSARFITSSSSTSRGRQAEKAQKYPLRLHQLTMSQQSTSCWIRRCNRQYIFLPHFTLVSRCRERDEKFLSQLVRKLHLRSPRTQSLHCLISGWTRAAGDNSLENRDKRERSFSQRKRLTMNALHSLENRARVLFAQRISHVCHLVSETLTRIGRHPKAFHNTHTSETRSPEGKKRMMCSTGAI